MRHVENFELLWSLQSFMPNDPRLFKSFSIFYAFNSRLYCVTFSGAFVGACLQSLLLYVPNLLVAQTTDIAIRVDALI